MKILNLEAMLEVAGTLQVHNYAGLVAMAELAADAIADAVAGHLGIVAENAAWNASGGLCVRFRPSADGQQCPAEIEAADPQGWWQ
ncbi:hypothetical protein [Rugamonas aquatica]|uniref:Uncharacterized protein n=1 Tax=Rugamonas aquatica TaxID=2743357 RepID=A0A6A7N6W9_9BURK|nr:hypothetical protein [Rugamonas aquatica]MQA40632.1 hypothetical protein [Rugamonas aquatica]